VAEASIENLQRVPGYDDAEAAEKLKKGAQAVVEKAGDLLAVSGGEAENAAFSSSTTSGGGLKDAKTLAEERLREMMKNAGGDTGKKDNV